VQLELLIEPLALPPVFYVMGPSGAGKDSVLRFARARLTADRKVAFAHRYITRPAASGDENHIALSDAEFKARRAAGLFAYDWQAHGFRYGIGIEIAAWRQAGFIVIVSGSREHFQKLQPRPPELRPVLIMASAALLGERLAGRGRENGSAVALRLQRAADYAIDDPTVVVIENAARLEEAGARLLAVLDEAVSAYGPDALGS
jgi:ribose 1,5-bisphosphokinase